MIQEVMQISLKPVFNFQNICAQLVGTSQIQEVFMPIWKEDDGKVWYLFETMLFRQIWQRDCVIKFHLHVDEV